jgi:formylglycine-generating enzyme required for sulfatase activity
MGNLPREISKDKKSDDLPVTYVSWENVQTFLTKLQNLRNGDKYNYRLPTEAEREFAARGGMKVDENKRQWMYSFGNDPAEINKYAWTSDNSEKKPWPVGEKLPNPLGLYDMHGNVFEWVIDKYRNDLTKIKIDPEYGHPVYQNVGSFYVLRGGAWSYGSDSARSAERSYAGPSFRSASLGFRIVRTLKP